MAESVSPSPAVPAGGTKGVPSKIRVGAGWRDGIESPDAARALEGWAASRLWRISPLLTALLLVALAPLAKAASFPCDKAGAKPSGGSAVLPNCLNWTSTWGDTTRQRASVWPMPTTA